MDTQEIYILRFYTFKNNFKNNFSSLKTTWVNKKKYNYTHLFFLLFWVSMYKGA